VQVPKYDHKARSLDIHRAKERISGEKRKKRVLGGGGGKGIKVKLGPVGLYFGDRALRSRLMK